MQKLITLLFTLILTSTFLTAQEIRTLTATVTRTRHHAAVTENQVATGKFYYKQPGKMCMTFNNRKEKLLMDDNTFIMVNDEKNSVAKGKEATHLALLQQVLQNILTGNTSNIDTIKTTDMEITRQDEHTIHITPATTGTKATRRMLFTSFTLTINPNTTRLESMRMNEKGGNYTQYDFSGYIPNETIDDETFKPSPQ
ncbi:MAG: outer membrane lipoprotein carrier protein LolA [Tannerellaceae bacterium]|nr:outer membrane lipoprotein carrier protein LolA [Tannerellaceae bacterium]